MHFISKYHIDLYLYRFPLYSWIKCTDNMVVNLNYKNDICGMFLRDIEFGACFINNSSS